VVSIGAGFSAILAKMAGFGQPLSTPMGLNEAFSHPILDAENVASA
jgi:hypothetical protein